MKNFQESKETYSKPRDYSCWHHYGLPWPKVNNSSVAHQLCRSTDALDCGGHCNCKVLAENLLRIMKTKRKNSPLRISSFSCPKLGQRPEEKKKEKVFTQIYSSFWPKTRWRPKTKSSPRFCSLVCSNFLPKLQRGGGHAAILRTILC